MPRLSFYRSPRPDQTPDVEASPGSQFQSRFGSFQQNVRTMINGSSVYSQSPGPTTYNTPKIPFLGFLRRDPPSPIPGSDNTDPRESNESGSPLRPQHTAGSYARTISPLEDPRQPETIYNRDASLNRHPADVPLGDVESHGGLDPEIQALNDEINGRRRRRRHHRRRKHRRAQSTHWVRRREDKGYCLPFVKGTAAQGKVLACIISSTFLVVVLAIYLALALTEKDLGQEVHVLFIMVILGTTIFFCHSLIRLCMLVLHPPEETPRIPSMAGPDGFQPVRPIRVHLVRDEEMGSDSDHDPSDPLSDVPDADKKLVPPPPAYGLWRSSVRVDPNLLHWQRVDEPRVPSALSNRTGPGTRNGSVSSAAGSTVPPPPEDEHEGPRPPSYVSEDGVSYIMEAAPRTTAQVEQPSSGVSDIHPAWRPGYAMSEVRADEWPAPIPMPPQMRRA